MAGIDPSIALGVRPQQGTDLLGDYGKALQLKSLIGQQQLLPGQLEAQKQENATRGVQLKNLQDVQAAYAKANTPNPDGSVSFDMDHLKTLLGTTPGGLDALKNISSFEKGQADLQESQGKVDLIHRDNGGSLGAAVHAAGDDPHLFLTMVANGIANKAIDPKNVQPHIQAVTQALQTDPTGESSKPLVKQISDTLIANSPSQQKLINEGQIAAAATSRAASAATEARLAEQNAPNVQKKTGAEAISAEAKATLDTAKANLVAHPEQYAQIVDSLFPNDKTGIGERTKQQVQFYIGKGQIDEANRALDNAVETANAPAKAASVAAATAPINISEAVAKETDPRVIAARTNQAVTTAKALRMGDNPAIQRVPPAEVGSVMSQAQKLDEAAIKANATTEAIGKVLDLATSGNKAAGANVPLVGVGALNAVNGIKRINSAEIAQYGTAGSLLDKIQGKLQGWTEGQPIPQDIIDDMRTLHQMLGEQGYKTYTDSLNSLNDRTGSAFKPNVAAPNIRQAPVTPIQLKDGRTLTPHTQADADQFRKDHADLIK